MSEGRALSARHLDWQACYNVRDLGGLPLTGGGKTRWGSIVRADLLARLTPAGRGAMLAYGVRTVIDLRGPHEVKEEPTIRGEPGGLAVHNLPLEGYRPEVSAQIARATSHLEVYALILDHYPGEVAQVLRAIDGAPPGGVVIHCHAGKDRTGIMSALLLGLAEVPEEAIVADYAESQERLWPLWKAQVAGSDGDGQDGLWQRPTTKPETMAGLLEHLRVRYGGVEAYIRGAGLRPEEVARLKRRLLPEEKPQNR